MNDHCQTLIIVAIDVFIVNERLSGKGVKVGITHSVSGFGWM